jgi:hypothetical protein
MKNVEIIIDCDDRFKLDYHIKLKSDIIMTNEIKLICDRLDKFNNMLPPYSKVNTQYEWNNLYHDDEVIIDIANLEQYADIVQVEQPFLKLANGNKNGFININGYILDDKLYYKDELILDMDTFKKYAHYKEYKSINKDDPDDKPQDFYNVYLSDGTDEKIMTEENVWIQTLIIDGIAITNAHFVLFVDL